MSTRRYFWLNVTTPAVAPGDVPVAVDDLAATGGNGQVALAWTAPDPGDSPITGYQILRSIAGGSYALLTTVTGTSYTDTGLVNGVVHAYKVRAVSALGASADSNIDSDTPAASGGYITPGPRAFSYPSQPAPTGSGTTVTVAPSGLQAAITAATAGSVIVVTNGTGGNINITNKSGSAGNPITIYSQNHLGAKFTLTGTGSTDGFWMDGSSSYWRIIGLELSGTQHPTAPIRVRGSVNNVSFENCYMHTGVGATTPQSTVFVMDDTLNYISFKKCEIRGTMNTAQGHALRCWRVQNVLVEDCTLSRTRENLIEFQNARYIDVRYNHFSKAFRGGYHFAIDPNPSNPGWDKGEQDGHHWDYNVAEFMGEWNPGHEGQNIVQYQNSAGADCRIRGNISKRPLPNASPYSTSEDHVNMGRSGGVSGSPFLIEHNRLRGGGPSGTGTGIITDGGDDYIHIQDNTVDRTGQVGIGVAGGNNIIVRRNKVYGPATTFTATNQGTNVGIYAWVNSLGATNGCSNITIQNNRVFWAYGNAAVNSHPFGRLTPYWDGGNCGSINWANGNTWSDSSLSGSIFDEPIPA